ncbi:RH40 [Symbiodinium natans]|uniref:RNA helicase n=1 Tax=Symbiodinium natans TaxID=878477 RepID=A0A812JCQ1_9DINO|nr:RH40 [Symbiodinium natans]
MPPNVLARMSEMPSRAEMHEAPTGAAAVPQASPDVQVEVRGSGHLPSAWRTWEEVTFPPRVRAPLVSAGFPAPTAIQQHSWPILTAGRDLIGVAKTGSGKTLAFLLPIFARLLESKADLRGPPAALVLAPTRELACQIEVEAKRFGATAGMRAACLYGGAPKGPQLAELRQRPQLLVATPGRLNDLLEPPPGLSVAVDVKSVRYLVLDEADRMLDMGFEPQIRKIIAGLPQDRQTVMFTATWPLSIRRLAADFLRDAAEVRAGEVDELRVNPDITQHVVFCSDMRDKEEWLDKILRESGSDQAIVFVNTKRMCEVVSLRTPNSMAIHGDKDQRERDLALGHFKSGSVRVLVATDVAARGLDIKAVKVVVNFDPPNREEDYVHRVGRTGRAGQKGLAWTLLTNEDGAAARSIAAWPRGIGVPADLGLVDGLCCDTLYPGAHSKFPFAQDNNGVVVQPVQATLQGYRHVLFWLRPALGRNSFFLHLACAGGAVEGGHVARTFAAAETIAQAQEQGKNQTPTTTSRLQTLPTPPKPAAVAAPVVSSLPEESPPPPSDLMVALLKSRDTLPAEVRALLDAQASTEHRVAAKMLHKYVALKTAAERGLADVQRARAHYAQEWGTYLSALGDLLQQQMVEKQTAMEEFRQTEDRWRLQLATATKSLAQASGATTGIVDLEADGAELPEPDMVIDVDAEDATKPLTAEALTDKEAGLLESLKKASHSADSEIQELKAHLDARVDVVSQNSPRTFAIASVLSKTTSANGWRRQSGFAGNTRSGWKLLAYGARLSTLQIRDARKNRRLGHFLTYGPSPGMCPSCGLDVTQKSSGEPPAVCVLGMTQPPSALQVITPFRGLVEPLLSPFVETRLPPLPLCESERLHFQNMCIPAEVGSDIEIGPLSSLAVCSSDPLAVSLTLKPANAFPEAARASPTQLDSLSVATRPSITHCAGSADAVSLTAPQAPRAILQQAIKSGLLSPGFSYLPPLQTVQGGSLSTLADGFPDAEAGLLPRIIPAALGRESILDLQAHAALATVFPAWLSTPCETEGELAVFDPIRQMTSFAYTRKQSLGEVLSTVVERAPFAIASLRFISPLPSFPSLQIVLTPSGLPADMYALPIDGRPAFPSVCTVNVAAGGICSQVADDPTQLHSLQLRALPPTASDVQAAQSGPTGASSYSDARLGLPATSRIATPQGRCRISACFAKTDEPCILQLADCIPQPKPGLATGVVPGMLDELLSGHKLASLHTEVPALRRLDDSMRAAWNSLPPWQPCEALEALFLYTDGSWDPHSKCAAWAVVCVARQKGEPRRVGCASGICCDLDDLDMNAYRAECEALLHARSIGLTCRPVPVIIASDCSSALGSTHGQSVSPASDWISETAISLMFAGAAHGQHTQSIWIPAHEACFLNGLADALAHAGATGGTLLSIRTHTHTPAGGS